jgi:hypothetical protein
MAESALNEPRNLTSTTATPQKQRYKAPQKIEKRPTIKEGIKTLQRRSGLQLAQIYDSRGWR